VATPVQNAPWTHALQSATKALSTLPKVPAGQLQLVKAMLPANDTEGVGHKAATDDPAAQKLPGGQIVLELLDVHKLPAGHTVTVVLPASQNDPVAHAVAEVEPAVHTVPAGHWSCTVEFGHIKPAAQRV
jgi:hypothetical protein